MADLLTTAWSDPESRRRWRRARLLGRCWLAVGLACLVGVVVYASSLDNHVQWLRENGLTTSGTVVSDPPESLRCSSVPVPIEFDTATSTVRVQYWVDGCSGGGLRDGQQVTIVYDPMNPTDFALNGSASEDPTFNTLFVVAFVAGVALVGMTFVRALRLHRMRRVLVSAPWRAESLTVAEFRGSLQSGGRAVALGDAVAITLGPAKLPLSANLESRVCGDGPWVATETVAGGPLTYLRLPRTRRGRRRARQALGFEVADEPST